MPRSLVIVGIVAVTAACAPIRTTIENDTGAAVELEVTSTSGNLIAKGVVPASTGLDLEEKLGSIATIRYTVAAKKCLLRGAVAQAQVVRENGADSVHLRVC